MAQLPCQPPAYRQAGGPDRGRGRWTQAGTRMTKKRVMKAMSTFSRPAFGSLLLKDKEYRFGFGYAWANRHQVI